MIPWPNLLFAEVVDDAHLADDLRALARHLGVNGEKLDDAAAFARDDRTPLSGDRAASAALVLARAASFSPVRVDATTIAACRDGELTGPAIVEIVTWLAVLQMLHRLTCFTVCAE